MSKLGYPGVNGPDAPKKDDRVEGTVLGSDAVNTLIRTPEGDVRVLPNSKIKR